MVILKKCFYSTARAMEVPRLLFLKKNVIFFLINFYMSKVGLYPGKVETVNKCSAFAPNKPLFDLFM